jgi:hypothetical protein
MPSETFEKVLYVATPIAAVAALLMARLAWGLARESRERLNAIDTLLASIVRKIKAMEAAERELHDKVQTLDGDGHDQDQDGKSDDDRPHWR